MERNGIRPFSLRTKCHGILRGNWLSPVVCIETSDGRVVTAGADQGSLRRLEVSSVLFYCQGDFENFKSQSILQFSKSQVD